MVENDVRTLLLEAIEGSLLQPVGAQQQSELPGELQQNVNARATWWSHVRDRFFMGDETRMLRELLIDRNAFEDLVNAVVDLPLQRRGRRAFVFTHRRTSPVSPRVSRIWTSRRAHAPPPENQVPVGSQYVCVKKQSE